MAALRDSALVHTLDQWRLAAHQDTSIDDDWRVVLLARKEEPAGDAAPRGDPPIVGGLAFDGQCRLYRSVAAEGRVERVLLAPGGSFAPLDETTSRLDLFERTSPPMPGGFSYLDARPTTLCDPRGLAVDEDGRLFIAEHGAGRIVVIDLFERRLLRTVDLGSLGEGRLRPLDVAAWGRRVIALLDGPPYLAVLDARTGPRAMPIRAGIRDASRVAVSASGGIYFLTKPGTVEARVVSMDAPGTAFDAPFGTDLEFDRRVDRSGGLLPPQLVVARFAHEDFLRFALRSGAVESLPPLRARGYDGGGIVRAPDGRIGFWTDLGFRHAVAARVRYKSRGRVTTFRLDSGEFQTIWGRLFLDACIPEGTDIRVHCATADEPPEEPTLDRTPPSNAIGAVGVLEPRPGDVPVELLPPMPPRSLLPAEGEVEQRLHRRETGRELPWSRRAESDPFETYEAPVRAAPGRYLWVTIELRGDTRLTPRFKSLRVEHPSHELLRQLPREYSRDVESADFLRRFLAMFEGFLGDLDAKASARRALIDPRSAPEEFLPWLAGFVGLVLDERWPTVKRRRLIREAVTLFRSRGTVPGLKRFLEIYLDKEPILVEHYQVRGLGGAIVGGDSALPSRAIVGGGFRVGGAVGVVEEVPLGDASLQPEDAFRTHAHRFSVAIASSLDPEQLEVVRHILEIHRPAHTVYDICTVDAGMRVGMGLHLDLTAMVGPGSGFAPLRVDGSLLGRDAVVGRPAMGIQPESSRVGTDARVG